MLTGRHDGRCSSEGSAEYGGSNEGCLHKFGGLVWAWRLAEQGIGDGEKTQCCVGSLSRSRKSEK